MNITVINGTEKHGVTYRLKEMFLTEFKDKADITEYYLPKDCPDFWLSNISYAEISSTCSDVKDWQ